MDERFFESCPSPELLGQFLSGKLHSPESEHVASHLDSCQKCLSTIDRVSQVNDTISHHLNNESPEEVLNDELYLKIVEKHFTDGHQSVYSPPFQMDQYQIYRVAGRGGMGIVYEAEDLIDNKVVAIKILTSNASSSSLRNRFRKEALALSRLNHRNIVRFYDLCYSNLGPYLVLEFISGGSLAGNKRIAGATTEDKLTFFRDLVDAVVYCHENQVLHRDIKPANVLIGDQGIPMLTDFGIAKKMVADTLDNFKNTATGAVLGTPAYMSPELARGEHSEVDVGTDIYSLGGVLFYLMCGAPPHTGADLEEVLFRIKNEKVRKLRKLNPETPIEIEAIANKCLQLKKTNRYSDTTQLLEDVRRFLDGQQPLALLESKTRARRNFVGWTLGTTVLVVGGAVGWRSVKNRQYVYADSLRSSLQKQQPAKLIPAQGNRLVFSVEDTELTFSPAETETRFRSTQSAGCILLQSTEWTELQIESEIRHDQAGLSDSGVGFVFFYNESSTDAGKSVEGVVVRFNEFNHAAALPETFKHLAPADPSMLRIYQYKAKLVGEKFDTNDEKRNGKSIPILSKTKDNVFRRFVFEVQKDKLRIVWQPHVANERAVLEYPFANLDFNVSAKNLGFGFYVYNGTATYRNTFVKRA